MPLSGILGLFLATYRSFLSLQFLSALVWFHSVSGCVSGRSSRHIFALAYALAYSVAFSGIEYFLVDIRVVQCTGAKLALYPRSSILSAWLFRHVDHRLFDCIARGV